MVIDFKNKFGSEPINMKKRGRNTALFCVKIDTILQV